MTETNNKVGLGKILGDAVIGTILAIFRFIDTLRGR